HGAGRTEMFRGKNRWLFRFGIVLAAAGGFLAWTLLRDRTPTLVVENQSGQPIAVLNVTAGGATSTAPDVPRGKEVGTPLHLKGEGQFVLDGKLQDDTLLRGTFRLGPDAESLHLIVMPGGQIILRPRGK